MLNIFQAKRPLVTDVKIIISRQVWLDKKDKKHKKLDVSKIHQTNTICIQTILKAINSSILKHRFIIWKIII